MKPTLQALRIATFAASLVATSPSFAQSASPAPARPDEEPQMLPPTVVTAVVAPPVYGQRLAPIPPGMRRRRVEIAYSGGPVPDGSWVETRADRVTLGLGIGALAGGWLGSLFGFFGTVTCYSGFFTVSCQSGPREMLIPVVGPWAALADPRNNAAGNTLLVIDGLVQTAGVAMIIAGAVIRHRVLVHEELTPDPRARRAAWSFAPTVSATTAGVAVTGTF